jgi:uncharacterized repeat protein (TIGR03917 family)
MAQPMPGPLPDPSSAASGPETHSDDEEGRARARNSGTDQQNRPCPAVGYVCAPGDEDQINELHRRLAVEARQAGLALVEVYVDRQSPGAETWRPGLARAIEEIGRRPDAVLLVPDLSHLPTSRGGWAAWEEWFTNAVTEIHTLGPATSSEPPVPVDQPMGARAGEIPPAMASRARLTAHGQFEVTARPDDDVASLIRILRQLPPAARFLESYGDVDTTLVFLPGTDAGPVLPTVIDPTGDRRDVVGDDVHGDIGDDLPGPSSPVRRTASGIDREIRTAE